MHLMLQRTRKRNRFAEDRLEEFVSIQRDGRALSVAGEMHFGFLCA
jgi:hypothetical protein